MARVMQLAREGAPAMDQEEPEASHEAGTAEAKPGTAVIKAAGGTPWELT